jgi:hypothetical protein
MPTSTVDREQGVERHLAAAAEYIAIAEAGDAARAAYTHAADEIIAAKEEDPKLSNVEIARRLKKSDFWVRTLIRWRNDRSPGSPFSRDTPEAKGRGVVEVQKIARERPKDFAAAFEQAPPAARKAIAKQISKAPEVRAEARKRDVEAETKRKPSPVKPRTDHDLYEFESRLVSARRDLRDALALVDQVDASGDDEDILDLLRDCEGLLSAVAEAYRSGKSIDTWAWELYERSAD